MKDILSVIKPEEALVILRYLAKRDSNIKEKILSVAEDIVKDVDVESICDDVFFVLDGIDVHELWDRAGPTSDGYASPEEMAFEMIEEELESFNQDVIRLCELNLSEESKLFCMGVLKGTEVSPKSKHNYHATMRSSTSMKYFLKDLGWL